MSRKYMEGRVKQALKEAGGNRHKAQQQMIAWTFEDHKFLQELAGPHLKGITAHAIGHVERLMEEPKRKSVPDPLTQADNDDFGVELLKSIAGGEAPNFGQENAAAPVGKTQASQRHIDAINILAAKAKKTKK